MISSIFRKLLHSRFINWALKMIFCVCAADVLCVENVFSHANIAAVFTHKSISSSVFFFSSRSRADCSPSAHGSESVDIIPLF